ncbi:IS1 family transposase [Methyloglobulus sp.]|uniref:IS1 family transposase n=1 Tax=Methyloglobulus sp. TaxID=2518622 RepID=UPI003988AB00
MSCPKCGSLDCAKDGIVKEKQRYRCKSCGHRHTVQHRGICPATKREALQLYLEGLGFRSIGRFLKCSHVAVYNWIKAHGESIEAIRSAAGVDVVEMDEMHTYIGSKKTIGWIWIAVDRHGKRFLNCEVDSRDTDTGRKLWDAIKNNGITDVISDYWSPYEKFVPYALHTQSKAETYTVEGYNSLFRHFLARLRRKSKCYSKSKDMLKYSVMLLMLKRNGDLKAILN